MRILIFIIILFTATYIYGQEEFFWKNDGISLLYSQGFNKDVDGLFGFALALYTRKGFSAGLGVQHAGEELYPAIALGHFIVPDTLVHPTLFYIGLTYTYIADHHVPGINFGGTKCFFYGSTFPFILYTHMSLQAILGDLREIPENMVPVFEVGYIQAFFASQSAYPFFGISIGYDINNGNSMVAAGFGLNLRLSRKTR